MTGQREVGTRELFHRLPSRGPCATLFQALTPCPRFAMPTITDDTTSGVLANDIDVGNYRSVLDTVRRMANVAGVSAYLVGGPVRDHLLGVPVKDLDVCVVGDAPALAARLAEAIGGRLTVHQRFGTASVATSDCTVDLVTARRETYRHAGALPDVSAGNLTDDLARRDFTINAMAIPIAGEAGELVDSHGGRADLSAGVIRILHPQSFRDDPTRILRAVRYAARFGFSMDEATRAAMAEALTAGAMATLTPDRVRHELERILEEPAPLAVLRLADTLGVLSAVHPSLSVAHLDGLTDTPSTAFTWLAALVWPLTLAEGAALGARLNTPADWLRVIADTARLKARLPQLEQSGLTPSGVCALLDGLSPDALRAAMLLAQPPVASERVRRYLAEWWSVAPRLRGSDLLELGVPAGPAVGEALRALRKARLDGETNNMEDEQRIARKWATQSYFDAQP